MALQRVPKRVHVECYCVGVHDICCKTKRKCAVGCGWSWKWLMVENVRWWLLGHTPMQCARNQLSTRFKEWWNTRGKGKRSTFALAEFLCAVNCWQMCEHTIKAALQLRKPLALATFLGFLNVPYVLAVTHIGIGETRANSSNSSQTSASPLFIHPVCKY